jgi:Immunoglobulin I-set domain
MYAYALCAGEYQDGKMVSADEHMKLDYSNGRCTLSIDRVSVDDEAEYICEARNAYGTASSWAELLVESEYNLKLQLLHDARLSAGACCGLNDSSQRLTSDNAVQIPLCGMKTR